MKLRALLLTVLLTFMSNSYAVLIFESEEKVKLPVNQSTLTCEWEERPAHSGTLNLPIARLFAEVESESFDHNAFTGNGYLPGKFSCAPVQEILESADENGEVEVTKNTEVYKSTHLDSTDGSAIAINKSETIRFTFSNGVYLESKKSKRTNLK